MFERAEENMMIEARFDPVEWRHEVDAVYKDLVNIQKDIDLARQRGGGEVSEEIEEHRRHIDLILECCREIQNASGYDVRKIFSKVGETLAD